MGELSVVETRFGLGTHVRPLRLSCSVDGFSNRMQPIEVLRVCPKAVKFDNKIESE
jgi:hypothetical protein